MNLRPAKKEEYAFIENFVYEVFKNTHYSDGVIEKELVKEIRGKSTYIPELDLVAEDNEEIVGHFILSKFPISQKHEDEILILTPVSVAINRQKQGVGTFMLNKGIELAREMGFKGIIVEGDWRYYQRFGFRTSTEYGIHASEKNLPPAKEYLMALELGENSLATISGEVDYSMFHSLSK